MERHVSSLFLLWTLTLTETWADSHSLRYLSTSVERPGLGEPRFFSVGYVDDRQFTRFDTESPSPREESRAPWMEGVDKVDPEFWERNTRFHKEAAQNFLDRLQTLNSYYNDTKKGVHILQHLCGCEVYQNLTFKRGFYDFSYDGRDFLALDTETYKWTPSVPRALITKLKMEEDENFVDGRKAYLGDECVQRLRTYLEIGKEALKIEPPSARVTRHTAPNGEVTLKCWTQDFYPKEISLTWLRDGEEQLQDMEFIETRPAGDGTFQKWAVVQMTSGQEGKYTCQVQHEGLSEPLTLKWEPPSPSTWLTVGIIAPGLLLITVIAGVRIWRKKTSGRDSTQRSVPL